jgi:hypothetical protein
MNRDVISGHNIISSSNGFQLRFFFRFETTD